MTNRPTETMFGTPVTPYGLAECAICDGPVTHLTRASGLWIGYCAQDARAIKDAFPQTDFYVDAS